jgi:hypothetical protein
MSNGLVPSADIIENQKEMNKQMDADYEGSKLQNITLDAAIKDMTDATKGILDDILGSGQSLGLWEIISKDNRLRGLGMVFILISSIVLLIRAVTSSK